MTKRHSVDEPTRRPRLFRQLLRPKRGNGYLSRYDLRLRLRSAFNVKNICTLCDRRYLLVDYDPVCRQTSDGQNGILNEITNVRSNLLSNLNTRQCVHNTKWKWSSWKSSVPHDTVTCFERNVCFIYMFKTFFFWIDKKKKFYLQRCKVRWNSKKKKYSGL